MARPSSRSLVRTERLRVEVEIQRPAEEIDAVFDGRTLAGLGPALDKLVAEDGVQAAFLLGRVKAAAVDDGGDVEERQAAVFLDVGAEAGRKFDPEGLRVRRLELQGRVFQLRGVLGLAQPQADADECDRQDGYDCFFHVVLLTAPISGGRRP